VSVLWSLIAKHLFDDYDRNSLELFVMQMYATAT